MQRRLVCSLACLGLAASLRPAVAEVALDDISPNLRVSASLRPWDVKYAAASRPWTEYATRASSRPPFSTK